MALINKSNIATGNVIQPQDLLNIVEGLDGTSASTTIIATGSFSGSFAGLITSASNAVSASFATTASYALNAGGGGFPYTGSAIISGSLIVTGSTSLAISANGPININGTGIFTGDSRVNLFKNGNLVATLGSFGGGPGESVGSLELWDNGTGIGSGGKVRIAATGTSYISASLVIGTNVIVSEYTFDVNGRSNFRDGVSVTGSLIANSITGSLQGTSSWANNAITASYALNAGGGGFPYTGSAQITGSLTVIGSSSADILFVAKNFDTSNRYLYTGINNGAYPFIDYNTGALYDTAGTASILWTTYELRDSQDLTTVNWATSTLTNSNSTFTSIDWNNCLLNDPNGTTIIDYQNCLLYAVNGVQSADFNSRALLDGGGSYAIDWNSRLLQDVSNNYAADWNTRYLYKSDGTTIAFDWENGVVSSSLNITGSVIIRKSPFAQGEEVTATGTNSCAQGDYTTAQGASSHAEGSGATAIGIASHAEGNSTIALGGGSHAEGYYTIASGSGQHVSGRFNRHGDDTSLFIIGNGNDNSSRSDLFRATGSIVEVTGSFKVSGSATISSVLTLQPQHPLPSGVPTGSFAVSSSAPPIPYFWNGSSWNALF